MLMNCYLCTFSSLMYFCRLSGKCGGGNPRKDNLTNLAEDPKDNSTCVDIQMQQSPRPQYDCEWFQVNPSKRCNDVSVHEFTLTSSGDKMRVQDFCCACNGGSKKDKCYDYPDWIDSHPLKRFNCSSNKEYQECFNSGNNYINIGHNANSACCVCGKVDSFFNKKEHFLNL